MMSKLDFSNYKIQIALDVNSDKLIFLKAIREWDKPTQSMLKNASAKAMKAGEQPLRCLICNQPLLYVESITQGGYLKHVEQTEEVSVICPLRQEFESHFNASDSGSESLEHLHLKYSAAAALEITEGVSQLKVETIIDRPEGYTGKYKYKIPDVQFVYGNMKYALEVQLSWQTPEAIQEREDYYSKANCQLIWLCHIDESRKSLDIRFNSTSQALLSDINQELLNEWKTGFKIARVSPIRFEIEWIGPSRKVGSWEMVPSFREDYLGLDELSISNMNSDDSVWFSPFESAVGSVQEYLSQYYSEKLDSISRFSESNNHRRDVDASKVAKRFLYRMGCRNETSIKLVESIYEYINKRYLIHSINQLENILHAIGRKAIENKEFSVILCAVACCYGLVEYRSGGSRDFMEMSQEFNEMEDSDEIVDLSDNDLTSAIQLFPALANCVSLENDSFSVFDVISVENAS